MPRRSLSWSEGLIEARMRYGSEGSRTQPERPAAAVRPAPLPAEAPPADTVELVPVDPRQSPPPFPGEHRGQRVSYGGLRWAWRRRRDEKGRYLPDLPDTPPDEAWHWVEVER